MRAALLKSAKRRRRARQWQPDQRPRQLTSPPDTGGMAHLRLMTHFLSGCVFISRILRTVAQSEFIGVGMSAFYGKVIEFYRFVIFSLFVMIIFALSSRSEPNPYLM